MRIRRLLVVSTEDSTKLSSWSNVPYLFCKNLEEQGIELYRYTLKENLVLRYAFLLVQKIKVAFGSPKSTWSYARSSIYSWSAQHQIDRELNKISVDGLLILSFSYGPRLPSKIPFFLFGDWSLEYAISCHLNRCADRLEKSSINRENKLIAAASHVFVMFPLAEKYIKNTLPSASTYYLGHVINAVEKPQFSDLKKKSDSFSLLFIGKPHYIEGARQLLIAYENLKPRFPSLSLDIIGMDETFFENIPDGVTCHGYLDKGEKQDRNTYYRLLRSARLFVNTNPSWASFSAVLEAMYFRTPIITSRYPEMIETFGEDLQFGSYYDCSDDRQLKDIIIELLIDPTYQEKAELAHQLTKKFSWESYVKSVLKILN